MPQNIGRVDLSGDGEERTWRVTIDFPAEAGEDDYTIVTHREIVVRNTSGEVIQRIRDEGTAKQVVPSVGFKARRRFKSHEANSKSSNIMPNLRGVIDQVVSDQKGAGNGKSEKSGGTVGNAGNGNAGNGKGGS
jgi:hypothetical protein